MTGSLLHFAPLTILFGLSAASAEEFRLENGLIVLLRPIAGAERTAMVTLFRLGESHDPMGKSGRAHLLEHLYITAAAGDAPARSVEEFARRFPDGWNAQTGSDYTLFATVFRSDELQKQIVDAAARMSDLRITDADLEREVPRVLVELANMYGGMPHLAAANHARKLLHPVAGEGGPGGDPRQVKALTAVELRTLWRDHYRPNNAILSLAGNFDRGSARMLIEKHFGPIAKGKEPPQRPSPPDSDAVALRRIKVKPVAPGARAAVFVGYCAPPPGHKEYAAFLVVVSRLWAKAGFKPGQVPLVHFSILEDPSTFGLQTVPAKGPDADEAVRNLDEQLQSVLTGEVKPDERTRVNSQFAPFLGTKDLPDGAAAGNVYLAALAPARLRQLGVDGKSIGTSVEAVGDADMKALAEGVLHAKRRRVVIVEPE